MKQHIHFVGIKGVGMTPLALIAKEAGIRVTGSDMSTTYITDELLKKAGIPIFEEFDKKHVQGATLVITTGAHGGFDNPEVKEAKSLGTQVLTQGEAVGEFMKGNIINKKGLLGVSVAGCHGKTTTSAMIATILAISGLDPSYAIGTGMIPSLQASGHFGKGEYFVAEADEYATEPVYDKTPKFLWQHPKIAVITNIEFDHPDLYPSIDDVRRAYEMFAKQVAEENGILIANGDDEQTRILLGTYEGDVITFGVNSDNDYVITLKKDGFILTCPQEQWESSFTLHVSGTHNIKNATAAIIVARLLEVSTDDIQKGLHAFSGTKRRMEFLGTSKSGALTYDDYAHHPTEIRTTLAGVREKYPDKKITVIFQPHTYSRTKLLFKDFSYSFQVADEVILCDIYPSARENVDKTISSEMLVSEMKKKKINATYLSGLSDVVQYMREKKEKTAQTVYITMGAGDIYTIAKDLLTI